MAQMEATKVSPPVVDARAGEFDLEHLQGVWREAVQDTRPGVAPEPVFRRLREKFAIARIARP